MTDRQNVGLRQPLLGLGAFVVTVVGSLIICALFTPETLGSWVVWLVMSLIPAQVILSLGLHHEYPTVLKRLTQPSKGLLVLLMVFIASAVVSPLVLWGVGGGLRPPTPFPIFFLIVSVCVSLWVVVVFGSWPVTALSKHPAFVGLGSLVLTYVLTWIIYRLFFDFSFLAKAPFYKASLDPGGLFSAWKSVGFILVTVVVLMFMVLLDFWPVTRSIPKRPALAKQPVFGLVSGALILVVSALIYWIGVGVAGTDPVVFLVRVPVSVLFGVFIMLLLFQTSPFAASQQPSKGAALIASSIVLGVVMQLVYGVAASAIAPDLKAGAPGYGLELWLANAMLGVTFPVIVAYCEGFRFWPLTRLRSAQAVQGDLGPAGSGA